MKRRPLPYQDTDLNPIPGEIFKDIKGFEGIYQGSTLGRIKSLRRRDRLGRPVRERIMKQAFDGDQVHVHFSVDSVKTGFPVGTLIGKTFLGDKKDDEVYCHLNKIKHDNRLKNLAIRTYSQSGLLDFQLGVKFTDGKNFENYNKKDRNAYESKFCVYDGTELIALICTKCMMEKTLDNFRIRENGYYRRACADCEDKTHHNIVEPGKMKQISELAKSGLKRCSKCKTIKSIDNDFHNDKTHKDGKRTKCKECYKQKSINQ